MYSKDMDRVRMLLHLFHHYVGLGLFLLERQRRLFWLCQKLDFTMLFKGGRGSECDHTVALNSKKASLPRNITLFSITFSYLKAIVNLIRTLYGNHKKISWSSFPTHNCLHLKWEDTNRRGSSHDDINNVLDNTCTVSTGISTMILFPIFN